MWGYSIYIYISYIYIYIYTYYRIHVYKTGGITHLPIAMHLQVGETVWLN